jgi:hypothetical protein
LFRGKYRFLKLGYLVSEINNPSKGGCHGACKEKKKDQKNCYKEETCCEEENCCEAETCCEEKNCCEAEACCEEKNCCEAEARCEEKNCCEAEARCEEGYYQKEEVINIRPATKKKRGSENHFS